MHAIAWYREFVPCEALRPHVRALFSFAPGRLAAPPRRPLLREAAFSDLRSCSPQFADGHVSMLFELGRTCTLDGHWHMDSTAFGGAVTGPKSAVGRIAAGDLPQMLGILFRPSAAVASLVGIPLRALTDGAIGIDDAWGIAGKRVAGELADLEEVERIDRIEAMLLKRLVTPRARTSTVNVEGLAAFVIRQRGQIPVEAMAKAGGVSRQHLTREFHDRLGITPKLYCRLARFQSGLAYSGCREAVDWAQAAADMGYTDQSHMIAEFRQFGGLTPQVLASQDWFHPFIERARRRYSDRSANTGSIRDARLAGT
jgi:AraC-like DNA-binding protein